MDQIGTTFLINNSPEAKAQRAEAKAKAEALAKAEQAKLEARQKEDQGKAEAATKAAKIDKIRSVFLTRNLNMTTVNRARLKCAIPGGKENEMPASQAVGQTYTIIADANGFSVDRSDWKGAGNIQYGAVHDYGSLKSIYFSGIPGSLWLVFADGKYLNIIGAGANAPRVQELFESLKAAGVVVADKNPYGYEN